MRVKALKAFYVGTTLIEADETKDVPDHSARSAIDKGLAESAEARTHSRSSSRRSRREAAASVEATAEVSADASDQDEAIPDLSVSLGD